jgi:replicative DNA helicase
MIRSGKVADGITLKEAVEATGSVAEVGGLKYVFDLAENPSLAPELWDHCGVVADLARRRALAEVGSILAAAVNTQSAEEALQAHETALDAIRERQALHAIVESCADVDDVFAETDRDSLVETGFPSLDEACKGFERGALSIIAARPGVGKTAFSICVAASIAKTESVGFLSLDMQGRVIKQRLGCYLHWKQPGHRRSPMVSELKEAGGLSPDLRRELSDLLRGDIGRRILVNDRGGQNTRSVATQVRAWKRYCEKAGLPPLGAVFIDHIAKVAPMQKVGGLYEKTSYAANELLDLAKANPRIAFIALCQLSRDAEKSARRPVISDLRDSGKIEEDASMVLLLHREDMRWSLIAKNESSTAEEVAEANAKLRKCKGDLEVIIGKNRNSEQGAVRLIHSMAFNGVRDPKADSLEVAA